MRGSRCCRSISRTVRSFAPRSRCCGRRRRGQRRERIAHRVARLSASRVEVCRARRGRRLIITCGLSGCGKTTISQALLESIGAVRIRSDVERKRMHGIASARAERRATSRKGCMRRRRPTRPTIASATLARDVLDAGRVAVVDATFLRRSQRESFRALAAELEVPFVILAFEAKEATLRERVVRRQAAGGDPSDADVAVLAHQIATREPLTVEEAAYVVVYDAEAQLEAARAPRAWIELATPAYRLTRHVSDGPAIGLRGTRSSPG